MNLTTLPTIAELDEAARIVYEAMPPTPQYAWPLLAARLGTKVWVKHENHTPTGAFKVRGGLVYFSRLAAAEPRCPGVVSATRGNHGQSIGFAARRHALAATIVVPHGNSREKNAAMRALGVELIEHGDDFQEAREFAGRLAAERGLRFVPSFHRDLVLGVASYCMEFLRAVPDLEPFPFDLYAGRFNNAQRSRGNLGTDTIAGNESDPVRHEKIISLPLPFGYYFLPLSFLAGFTVGGRHRSHS